MLARPVADGLPAAILNLQIKPVAAPTPEQSQKPQFEKNDSNHAPGY